MSASCSPTHLDRVDPDQVVVEAIADIVVLEVRVVVKARRSRLGKDHEQVRSPQAIADRQHGEPAVSRAVAGAGELCYPAQLDAGAAVDGTVVDNSVGALFPVAHDDGDSAIDEDELHAITFLDWTCRADGSNSTPAGIRYDRLRPRTLG